jgi:hypothetical protein
MASFPAESAAVVDFVNEARALQRVDIDVAACGAVVGAGRIGAPIPTLHGALLIGGGFLSAPTAKVVARRMHNTMQRREDGLIWMSAWVGCSPLEIETMSRTDLFAREGCPSAGQLVFPSHLEKQARVEK